MEIARFLREVVKSSNSLPTSQITKGIGKMMGLSTELETKGEMQAELQLIPDTKNKF